MKRNNDLMNYTRIKTIKLRYLTKNGTFTGPVTVRKAFKCFCRKRRRLVVRLFELRPKGSGFNAL